MMICTNRNFSGGGFINSFRYNCKHCQNSGTCFRKTLFKKIRYSNLFDEKLENIEKFNANSKDNWPHCAKTNRELYDTLLLDPLFMGNNCNMYLWLQIATKISICRTKNGQFQNTFTFCNEKYLIKIHPKMSPKVIGF